MQCEAAWSAVVAPCLFLVSLLSSRWLSLGCWAFPGLCSAVGMCDGNAWKAGQGSCVCTLDITATLGTGDMAEAALPVTRES